MLDTNLLFDLALIQFADQTPERALKEKIWSSVRVLKTQGAVARLLSSAQSYRFITTHLVLVEVGVLARRTLWPKEVFGDRPPEWPFLTALRKTMTELRLGVHELSGEPRSSLRDAFGPTDADLVATTLALSKVPGGAALLTTDRRLANWCMENRVPCDHFDPLVPSPS